MSCKSTTTYYSALQPLGCSLINNPSIHFLYPLNPLVMWRGGWSLSQRSSGERRAIQRQTITHTLLRTSLETPINLTCMFIGCRSTWREPTHTGGEHANSTQKGPSWELNLELSRCEVTVVTTTPPCSPRINNIFSQREVFIYFSSLDYHATIRDIQILITVSMTSYFLRMPLLNALK